MVLYFDYEVLYRNTTTTESNGSSCGLGEKSAYSLGKLFVH